MTDELKKSTPFTCSVCCQPECAPGCAGLAIVAAALPVADGYVELRRLATAATPGPWKVRTVEHAHCYGGTHKENHITTAWIQGQLKDYYPVVTISFGVAKEKGGPMQPMVSINKPEADFIAAANPARILALLDELKRANERNAVLDAALTAAQKDLEFERRVVMSACSDLGLVSESLGIDPDDGGAEPILDAIEDLRAALAQAAPASPASVPVAGHEQLLADLYEFTKYAACSQRRNTGDFLDGLLEQIEKLQPQCAAALAAPLPPVVARKDAPQPLKAEWQRLIGPGQVKVGDKLRFTIGDEKFNEVAKLLLHAGTAQEEIIYNKRQNFYLITSMCAVNRGSSKNVEFLPDAARLPGTNGSEVGE